MKKKVREQMAAAHHVDSRFGQRELFHGQRGILTVGVGREASGLFLKA
jgi:hypothetical protein